MNTSVYYLTGMGGLLTEGLGAALITRGLVLDGRALSGEFRKLDFQRQVEFVAEDLTTRHWSENGIVIANSFGAYLFLHAQSQLPPYIGRVVLLSPIVGEFSDEDGLKNFVPPHASKLQELASENKLIVPSRLEIYVGEHDWQSNPISVRKLLGHTSAAITVVPNAGHMLPIEFVGKLIDRLIV